DRRILEAKAAERALAHEHARRPRIDPYPLARVRALDHDQLERAGTAGTERAAADRGFRRLVFDLHRAIGVARIFHETSTARRFPATRVPFGATAICRDCAIDPLAACGPNQASGPSRSHDHGVRAPWARRISPLLLLRSPIRDESAKLPGLEAHRDLRAVVG